MIGYSPSKNTDNDSGDKVIKTSQDTDSKKELMIWPKSVINKCGQNYENYRFKGLNVYNINAHQPDSINLIKIDSITLRKIHNYKGLGVEFTWGFNHDLKLSYFYSIDSCINGYYPITILELQKFSTYALYMYLFSDNGKIVSSNRIAWKGEVGRAVLKIGEEFNSETLDNLSDPQFSYLYSTKINDSLFTTTLVSPDSIINKSNWLSQFTQTELVITSRGVFKELDSRVWKE